MGIIARNNPIFDAETQELTANFYINLFKGNSQGISLLKARQECMAKKMTKLIEQELDSKEQMLIKIEEFASSLKAGTKIV